MSNGHKGFTIVELLVALALTGIVMAAVYKTFTSQQKIFIIQEQAVEALQEVRASMDIMAREIRMAGYDPGGAGSLGITRAEDTAITFTWNPDGNAVFTQTDDPEGSITYFLANGQIVRQTWSSPQSGLTAGLQQLVAENIDVLDFVYLDANGNSIPTPVNTQEELDRIRTVEIAIVARSARIDKDFIHSAEYFNLSGTRILQPQNDGCRRRVLRTAVRCRNLGT